MTIESTTRPYDREPSAVSCAAAAEEDWVEDPEARFDRLYRCHAGAVLSYARYRVGENAEDLVADTFAVAWRKIASVPADNERAWLLATARQISANQIRRRDTRRAHEAPALPEAAAGAEDPALQSVVERDALLGAVRVLPPLDREALLLVTWHDLTHAEAADVMNCSVTAFAVRLHRARRRLAKILHHREHLAPSPSQTRP